jgi:hypothetical protein
MKTKLLVLVFTIVFVSLSFAQTKPDVKLKNIGRAKISITRGKLLSKIDLSENVAGCAYVKKRAYVFNNADCSASSASFKLIDTTKKNNSTYFAVMSKAAPNCNVCGQCGACRSSFAIIWIKLDKNLKLVKKQSFAIEDCLSDIAVTTPKYVVQDCDEKPFNPKFVKDLLTIEFEKGNYKNNDDVRNYDFSHLEYNRKTPEKGFVVKTSKRKKSMLDN